MSLPIVIGITYDESAYYEQRKPSVDTYAGVYVMTGPSFAQGTRLFCTGDPVADFNSARTYAQENSDDIYLSSTFDFFSVHSFGAIRETVGSDGRRIIERVNASV